MGIFLFKNRVVIAEGQLFPQSGGVFFDKMLGRRRNGPLRFKEERHGVGNEERVG